MKKLNIVPRLLLGLIFFVFGLNGFFNFIPAPAGMAESLVKFTTALAETGYMFPIIKGLEVICGALFLANAFVPLALLLLAPIVVNIFLVHTFLDLSGLPMVLFILACYLFVTWQHKEKFKSVLQK